MAIDVSSPRSRRSLITAALGGVAAAAAATLTGAQRALAAGSDGAAVHVGDVFPDVRTLTWFKNTATDQGVLAATTIGGGIAVLGVGGTSDGVFGKTSGSAGYGVHGQHQSENGFGAAVVGEVTNPDGIGVLGNNYATHGHAQGAQGTTDSPVGWANTGWATKGGTALVGASGADFPSSRVPAKTGVYGYAEHGRGGVFDGPVSQLRLVPASGAHPHSGQAGDLFMDHANKLWLCKGGTSWHQLA